MTLAIKYAIKSHCTIEGDAMKEKGGRHTMYKWVHCLPLWNAQASEKMTRKDWNSGNGFGKNETNARNLHPKIIIKNVMRNDGGRFLRATLPASMSHNHPAPFISWCVCLFYDATVSIFKCHDLDFIRWHCVCHVHTNNTK